MRKILVGYDGSEASSHALDRACELAKTYGCPLTVLTAADDQLVRDDGMTTAAADEDLAQWTADQGAERARRAGVGAVATRVRVELPGDALAHESNEATEGYDLLVVGHRGRKVFGGLAIGGTARYVIDAVGCSVLVVR